MEDAYLNLSIGHFYFGSPTDSVLHYIQTLESFVQKAQRPETMMQVHWMYGLYYEKVNQPDKRD